MKRAFLLSVLFLGLMVISVITYNQTYAMLHFAKGGERTLPPEKLNLLQKAKAVLFGINLPRPLGSAKPSDVGLECETRTIKEPDGITLGAWFCPAFESDSLFILFHGYGADKSALLKEAAAFHEMGRSVLLVDFRGSGDSSEAYTTIGILEAKDVMSAVGFARGTLGYSRIYLYGKSMGGVAILRALARDSVQVDGVIVEAVFDTMLNTVRNRFQSMGIPSFPAAELLLFWGDRQFAIDAFENNPVEYVKHISIPALFLHGTNDPRARIEDGRRVFDALASKKKQFKELPGIGHEDYLASASLEWLQTVRAFLQEGA